MKFFSVFNKNRNKKYKAVRIYSIEKPAEEYYHRTIHISAE